ncbi:Ltp family lipoprotein [Lacticaseibacillus porcinae]|uniref:Ltp family lipoprotein n=1 Tax=Lacticaseibacillus porcinae TaxID=1123687 RepID=UPI000F799FD1|nr:Ltp family lipoprotein [Lacticaseibacillus porcinae]
MKNEKKPIYKRVWFWVIVTVIALGAISIPQSLNTAQEDEQAAKEASIYEPVEESSDSTTANDVSSEADASSESESSVATSSSATPAVPIEYTNALAKAQSYVDNMSFSQARLLAQLTSAYGEQFSQAAAEYAIAHVKADYNANALQKAKDYQNDMNMSPARIHDQLTSAYGEQFTNEQADYAIAHLND